MNYLAAQPSFVDFGTNYRGARLAGSFQVFGAANLKLVKCDSEYRGVRGAENVIPDWLTLGSTYRTGYDGLGWNFRVATVAAGFRSASLGFEFEEGTSTTVTIRANIKSGSPRLGDLVVCDPPLRGTTDFYSASNFTRFVRGLDFRCHYIDSISQRLARFPRTILIHGSGLIDAASTGIPAITKLLSAGSNIVLLADKFFQGTAEAACAIGAPYGMTLRVGREGGFRTSEEAERASKRYSNRENIRRHPLTKGVKRLYWHRPWPIECTSKDVIQLVNDAEDPRRCYVAARKCKGYIVIIGTSLLESMTWPGWPFDNDKLLANLLAGGDADKVNM